MRTLLVDSTPTFHGHNVEVDDGDDALSQISSALTPDQQPPSPWHSPIPYMFGGLAAMLGLISFALLILACSYWRVSGGVDDYDEDRESGEKESSLYVEKPVRVSEQKVVVIMAGELTPTYMANPVYAKGVNCRATAKSNVDLVGENARRGGRSTASDHDEKKDTSHSHVVIDIDGKSMTGEMQVEDRS